MPPREWPDRVQDILDAVADIERYVAGLTYQEFAGNREKVHAVLYNIGIIGEAVSSLPEELRDRHPGIPWRDIRNMRNVVTHVYFGVDLQRVWDVAQNRMDPLRQQLQQLVEDEGEDET